MSQIRSIFPKKVRSIADMAGALENIEGLESVVVLIEDGDGVWLMPVCFADKEPTHERINWMVDRAKLLLHGLVEVQS